MSEEDLQKQLKESQDANKALTDENKAQADQIKNMGTSDDDLVGFQKKLETQEARTKALEEENTGLKVARQREDVIKEFPNAAKFPEFVKGATKEEMTNSAKSIHERIQAEKDVASKEKEADIAKVWGTVKSGPSSFHMKESDLDADLKDATEKHDIGRMMKNKILRMARKVVPT